MINHQNEQNARNELRIEMFIVCVNKRAMFRRDQAILHVIKKLFQSMTKDTKTIEIVERTTGTEGT